MQSPVEQVIDVPKIPEDSIQQRLVDRDSHILQVAEQLVEVPTVLTLAVLAEQIVDIPVPRGCGVHGGLQGSPPRQSSTASGAEQIVDFPVGGGLQGFLPRQGSQTANKIVDIPVGEGLQDFLPNPHLVASFAISRREPNQGVFRTFHHGKKSAEVGRQVGTGVVADSCSSTLATHHDDAVPRDDSWVHVMTDDRPYFWHREEWTNHWQMPPGTRPGWVMSRDGLFVHIDTNNVLRSLPGMY